MQIYSAKSLFGLDRSDENHVVTLLSDYIDNECKAVDSLQRVLAVNPDSIQDANPKLGSSVVFYLTSVMQKIDANFLTMSVMEDGYQKSRKIASTYSFLFTAGMSFRSQLFSVEGDAYVHQLKEGLISSIFLLQKPTSTEVVLNLEKSLSNHLQKCIDAGSSAEKFADAILSAFLTFGVIYLKQGKELSSVQEYLLSLKKEWDKSMPTEEIF